MTATFNGISGDSTGQTLTVNGFWDGGSNWKVRFAPPAAGDWSYSTHSSDTGLDGISGMLSASDWSASELANNDLLRGHIRTNPLFPQSLMHDDGTPFLLVGDTQWSFTTAALSWPDEFKSYIDARSAQGFNYIHGVIYQTWPSGNDGNEGGQAFLGNDIDRLNPGFWSALDQRIEYMNQKGIVTGFMLAWASDGWQAFDTVAQVDRFAQYVIDRYGAYNLAWILAGEYEESSIPGGYNRLGNYFVDNDPYSHLRTTHTVNTSADDFGNEEWHTLVYQQTGNPAKITADLIHSKPVINSEFGYEGNVAADEVRKMMWEIVMRGGSYVYGNSDTYHYDAVMTSANLYSPGAAYSSHLQDFFALNVRWWELIPSSELATGSENFVLANSGTEYVVYLPSGGETILKNVEPGEYEVTWLNPRTGGYQAAPAVTGGAAVVFTAPDNEDWVLHLISSSDSEITPTPPATATQVPTFTSTPSATSAPTDPPAPTNTVSVPPSPTAPPPTMTATKTPAPTATATRTLTPTVTATSTAIPTGTPTPVRAAGDLNSDGLVNVLDIQLCVNVFLGLQTDPEIVRRADANYDGEVSVLDVQLVVNLYLAA